MNFMRNKERIGVFGGSFNPVHKGHLEIAEKAMKECGLQKVLLIPAGDPYMKEGTEILPAAERMRLTELAVRDIPGFTADPLEVLRDGPSYTVDTLETLRERYPDSRLFLIVGEDAFRQMPSWKDPERIVRLADIVVAGRKPSADVPEYGSEGPAVPDGRLHRIDCEIDISSTGIRKRIRAGEPVTGLLPESAEKEIVKAYREFIRLRERQSRPFSG